MIEREIAELVREAIRGAGLPDVDFDVTVPQVREHGDFSVNAALKLQKGAGRPPRQIAEDIVRHLPPRDWILKVEVAGPGFINLWLSNAWLHSAVKQVLDEGAQHGRTDAGRGASVNVEFVSINPTGPLHVGAARNAALGDAIARMLEARGYRVTREYYFNDAGRQMELFGESVAARYLQLIGRDAEIAEDGYRGEYVIDLARRILDEHGDALDADGSVMRELAYPIVIGWIENTLERFGVHFDMWFKERDLYESGRVSDAIERLRELGHVYESEGAIWLASEALGDSRDRVLVKSSGEMTYLAGDIAYHLDKAQRGYRLMIDVWGADHHAQVPSLLTGMKALGVTPERLEVVIYQFVHMLRGGEPVPMSKRTGDVLSLDELMDEVGPDAARYTLLRTSAEQDLRFDIEEVKRQSDENPVYYVQYAHARIASILRKAPAVDGPLELLEHPAEIELMRQLAAYEEAVEGAAEARAPHRVARYCEELARLFHRFYTECRVIGDDERLTGARLALCRATKQVLANGLGLLGVDAPDRMERAE